MCRHASAPPAQSSHSQVRAVDIAPNKGAPHLVRATVQRAAVAPRAGPAGTPVALLDQDRAARAVHELGKERHVVVHPAVVELDPVKPKVDDGLHTDTQ